MRVPGRWVVSLGLCLYASGCLPAASPVSLGPPTQADLTTVAAERPSIRLIDSGTPAQPKEMTSKTKWILIGAGAAVLVVAIVLIAGGGSSY